MIFAFSLELDLARITSPPVRPASARPHVVTAGPVTSVRPHYKMGAYSKVIKAINENSFLMVIKIENTSKLLTIY